MCKSTKRCYLASHAAMKASSLIVSTCHGDRSLSSLVTWGYGFTATIRSPGSIRLCSRVVVSFPVFRITDNVKEWVNNVVCSLSSAVFSLYSFLSFSCSGNCTLRGHQLCCFWSTERWVQLLYTYVRMCTHAYFYVCAHMHTFTYVLYVRYTFPS